VIGAKAHSSGSAVEVITGSMPMRIRIRERCSREYLRILCKDEAHYLRQLLSSCARKGLCFCPLNYLSLMSKQMCRSLEGCSLSREVNVSDVIIIKPAMVVQQMVVSSGIFGFSNWSQSERQRPVDEVNVFVESNKGKSVMVFTDGSVYDGSVGYAACAAVLVPIHGDEDK